MNLMINNYCNLHCSYCFAQEEMGSHKATNITIEDFNKYLDFLQNDPDPNTSYHVRLIGGEPTLCPYLDQLIDEVIKRQYFEDILIFSNFTFGQDVADMLLKKMEKIRISFLPNINGFDLLIPKYKERILANYAFFQKNTDIMINIGINLYDPNMDLSQWEDIICKFNLTAARYSIVVPNKKIDKDFDFYQYFHSFQPLLLRMTDMTRKYGIWFNCDCNNLPLCCFDDDAVVEMLKVNPDIFGRPNCENPVIDISPDLMARGCFGCKPESKRYLMDFNSERELEDYFNIDREEYRWLPARKECLECSRFSMYHQSCGCLSYHKKEDNKL